MTNAEQVKAQLKDAMDGGFFTMRDYLIRETIALINSLTAEVARLQTFKQWWGEAQHEIDRLRAELTQLRTREAELLTRQAHPTNLYLCKQMAKHFGIDWDVSVSVSEALNKVNEHRTREAELVDRLRWREAFINDNDLSADYAEWYERVSAIDAALAVEPQPPGEPR